MAFGRVLLGWAAVWVWLAAWSLAERRASGVSDPPGRAELAGLAGEAALLALFGALWFGSLGSGQWWLVFVLVGALMEWPVRSWAGAARIARIVVVGGLLAWVLGT